MILRSRRRYHYSTCRGFRTPHRLIQMIKAKGLKAGMALNPATPCQCLEHIIEDLDMVLIMSVNPALRTKVY